MKFDQDALLAGIDAFNDVDYILAKSSTAKLRRAISAYLKATNSVIVPVEMGQLLDYAIKSFEHNGMEHWKQCEQMKRCRALLQASQESE